MQHITKPLTDIAHIIGNAITRLFDLITRPIATILGVSPQQVWKVIGQALLGILCLWQGWQIISNWLYGSNETSPFSLAILTITAYILLAYLAYRIFKRQKTTHVTPMPEVPAAPPISSIKREPIHRPVSPPQTTATTEDIKLLIQKQVQVAVEAVVPAVTARVLETQLSPLIQHMQQLMTELQTVKASNLNVKPEAAAPAIARKSAFFRFECETADVILVHMETSLYWEIEQGSEFARGEKEIEELVVQSLQSALTMSISGRTLSDIKISLRQVQDLVRADATNYLKKYVKVHRLDFLLKQMSLPKEIVERVTQQRASQAYSNTDQMSATGITHMPSQPASRTTWPPIEIEEQEK
ncbi:MAG: SPFH domain-containing protein [Chloroflexota bacterium]|jgi:hypothetical protein|nr:hypothetical protein [Chloroflexota bacterium]